MFQTVYLGKLLGIKVYIHWTFWFLALYVGLSNLGHGLGVAASAIGFVFAIFGCVFLHEMGHAIAGKWFRIPTLDITLYPIGGVARMADFTRSPFAELIVAIAGPMVNLAIATVLFLGLSIRASLDQVSMEGIVSLDPMEQLLIANIVLAVFNMLPAFPMDGGRVLRSLLAMMMPYAQATRYAARVGQVMAILMLVAGIYWNWSLAIIAVMVFLVCSGELFKERLANAASQFRQPQSPFPQGGNTVDTADTIDAVEVRQVDSRRR